MYQIKHITDKEGVAKAEAADRAHLGCIGDAKMEDGCVLFHCRYDSRGSPATGISVPAWSRTGKRSRNPAGSWWRP